MVTVNRLMPEAQSTELAAVELKPQGQLTPAAHGALATPVGSSIGATSVRPVGAYIGNAHSASNNWGSLEAAGLAEGDWYVDGDNGIQKCMPMQYWVYCLEGFGTDVDASMEIIKATDDKELLANQRRLEDAGYKEHYVAVCLVDMGDSIIPAKADFRSTKSNAAKVPINWLRNCVKEDWPGLNDENRIASAFPYPFGRVYFTSTTRKGVVRSGKAKGKSYWAANAVGRATTAPEMARLTDFINSPIAEDRINQVYETFAARVKQIRDAIGK